MFDVLNSFAGGVNLLRVPRFGDDRGSFTKPFHLSSYASKALDCDFSECFYSASTRNVLRGMHFQTPPHDHAKLVHVISGEILDVVVDIRRDSATFGQCTSYRLSADDPQSLHIASGFAHGFLTLSEQATVMYLTTSEHNAEADAGIAWNSFGFDWPVASPVLSPRDSSFEPLARFDGV